MLVATGRLPKCRSYEMAGNKAARATSAHPIVRDEAYQETYAKALPIPAAGDATEYPKAKEPMDRGPHNRQHHSRLDGSRMARLSQGASPTNNGATVVTMEQPPEGAPLPAAPELLEEFRPGLPPELKALAEAAAAL